jgi:WD40 repeat protein
VLPSLVETDLPALSQPELLALLRASLRRCWQGGHRVGVEALLARLPRLRGDGEVLLHLIDAEVSLREEAGERPDVAEYQQRFPHVAESLARQMAVREVLREPFFREVVSVARKSDVPPPPEAVATTVGEPPRQAEESRRANASTGPFPTIPGYEILSELGRGGMGVVYEAEQTAARRTVALKMILGGQASEGERARFKTEAEAIARLQHPGIVQVFEVGEHAGTPFFTLEFCAGGSLAGKLKGTPLPPREAAGVVESLARAVKAAHDKGVLHRDLKPGNVLLTEDGTPKVTDFGLAKKLDDVGQTQSGAVMGTPSYMAPEQAQGRNKELGPACDVYALGAILYECLTGRPPFKAATVVETLMQVVADDPAAVRQLNALVPVDLETVCLKCLRKDPGQRYESASALAEDLRRFQAGEPVAARPVGAAERGWRWCRRNPVLAGMMATVAVVVLTAATGGTGLFVHASQQSQRAEERDKAARNETDLRKQSENARAEAVEAKGKAEEEKSKAEEAKGQAERASGEADVQRKAAEDAKALNARFLMCAQLARAEALSQSDPGQAKELLYDVNVIPIALRDTAWRVHERACSRWELATLRGHTDMVFAVAYSPDGQTLATGAADQTVRLWDPRTGQTRVTLKGHTGGINSVVFAPDGQTVVTGSLDSTVRLWDATTGRPKATLQGHTAAVALVAFAPDGQTLATGSHDTTVRLWDVTTGRTRATLQGHTSPVTSLAFGPDGSTLATGSGDQTVRLWDPRTGQARAALKEHTGGVTCLAFCPGGSTLAIASPDQSVRLWDATTGQHKTTLRGPPGANAMAFSPDGQTLATGSADRTVRLWDATTGQHKVTLRGHMSQISSVVFSPDGLTLASASWDQTVRLWDVTARQPKATFRGHAEMVTAVAFSPDGRTLVSGSWDQTVRLWDAQTGRTKATLQGHTDLVSAVAFGPDGLSLASGSSDETVRLWDAGTGHTRAILKGHTSNIRSVVFSPDGQTLASGSNDKTVRLWDAGTGQTKATLHGHTLWVLSVAFSPDGHTLASGSEDKTVRLWDARTGPTRAVLRGPTDFVRSVAFSPDGRRIFAWDAATDKVLAWTVEDGQPADAANPPRPAANQAISPDKLLRAEARGNVIALVELADYDPQRDLAERLVLDATNRANWHLQQVEQAEQGREWFAAAFHLGQLLKDQPDDADLLKHRKDVLDKLPRAENVQTPLPMGKLR